MIDIKNTNTSELLSQANEIFDQTRPFAELMMRYKCAMLEVKTKLDVLNTQLSLENDRNPFESIACRLKSVPSIIEKLNRKGLELSAESIEKNLNDVAGIRVICSFPEDIYILSKELCTQDDIRLIACKDYIKNPKPNGYRSLHLIVEVPVSLSTLQMGMPVEIQLRTISMNMWASLEHEVSYKVNADLVDSYRAELKACADDLFAVEERMQKICHSIRALPKNNGAREK